MLNLTIKQMVSYFVPLGHFSANSFLRCFTNTLLNSKNILVLHHRSFEEHSSKAKGNECIETE